MRVRSGHASTETRHLTCREHRLQTNSAASVRFALVSLACVVSLAIGCAADVARSPQATEEGNAILARRVAELALGTPAVELYAGAGNLTVLLARAEERELVAVETSKEACAAARSNLAARGLTAKVVEADAASFILPKATRLLVLDPPREGARAACAAAAARTPGARSKLSRIVYVSCDPATLARDVKILAEGGFPAAPMLAFSLDRIRGEAEAMPTTIADSVRGAQPQAPVGA